jgi:hypothetical protein
MPTRHDARTTLHVLGICAAWPPGALGGEAARGRRGIGDRRRAWPGDPYLGPPIRALASEGRVVAVPPGGAAPPAVPGPVIAAARLASRAGCHVAVTARGLHVLPPDEEVVAAASRDERRQYAQAVLTDLGDEWLRRDGVPGVAVRRVSWGAAWAAASAAAGPHAVPGHRSRVSTDDSGVGDH